MTFVYPLTFPSNVIPASSTFRGRSVNAITPSPFTGQQQVQTHQGQWWELAIELPIMGRGADAEEFTAFLMKLNGKQGTFLFGDPVGGTARGTASVSPGTPLVNLASQTGNTLNIKGATAGAATYLLPGDYIQLGSSLISRLYKVLNTVIIDSVGDGTIDIWPSLRTSPGDGDTVIVDSAVGLWRLADNVSGWSITAPQLYSLSLNAIEAI